MPVFNAVAVLKSLVDLRNVCKKTYESAKVIYDKVLGKLQSNVTDLVSALSDEDYATVLEKANEDILETINSQSFPDGGAGGDVAGGDVAGGVLFNNILEFIQNEDDKYIQQTTILRNATGNIGKEAVRDLTADSPLGKEDVSLKLKVEKLLNYVYQQRGLVSRTTGCKDDSYFIPSDIRVAIYVFELMNGEPEYQASEYTPEMLEKSISNFGKVPDTTPTTVSQDYVRQWQHHRQNGTGPFYQHVVCAPWGYGDHGTGDGTGMEVDTSGAGGGTGAGGMGGGKKRKSKKQSKKQSKKSKRSKKSSKRKTRR